MITEAEMDELRAQHRRFVDQLLQSRDAIRDEVRRLQRSLEHEQRISGERLHELSIARALLRAAGKGDVFELALAGSLRAEAPAACGAVPPEGGHLCDRDRGHPDRHCNALGYEWPVT